MSASMFNLLNLSTGEYVTMYELQVATYGFKYSIYNESTNQPNRWYVSPPSHKQLMDLSRYFTIPVSAFECITTHQGYTYDAQD